MARCGALVALPAALTLLVACGRPTSTARVVPAARTDTVPPGLRRAGGVLLGADGHLRILLAARAGALALARLPDSAGRARFRVHVMDTTGTAAAPADTAAASSLVRQLRGAGELLDPEGRPDFSRVFEAETEVDVPVRPRPGCYPRYPDDLRMAGLQGSVLASFVVTVAGVPDSASVRAVRSTHRGFEDAVRTALRCMRFTPAVVRGRPVRARVQQPFRFEIRNDP